ncbi:hypothetical protein BGX38DRAFT_1249251 [Terfezia claveryi]|nr:hypothetical protein BGX38DRAFT_1249251 [Terfezia claveryi]
MLSTLLSLPALPLLLFQSNTSIPTFINLLFFQLTWSTLVLSHPPLIVELAGSLLIRLIFFALPSLIFLFLDACLPATTERWKSKTTLRARKRGGKKLWSVIAVAFGNIALATGVQGVIEGGLVYGLGWKSALRIAKTLPSPTGVVWDIFCAEVGREILTYGIHRYLLHNKSASSSRGLVKAHRNWAHAEYGVAGGFNAQYDHPVAYLLRTFLPMYLPAALVLRMHVLTWFIWLMMVSLLEVVGYSGYIDAPTGWVPFGFGLECLVGTVDGHFGSRGGKGFGVWGVVDWAGGTKVVVGGENYVKGRIEKGREWVGNMMGEGNVLPSRGARRKSRKD